ncbi:hypothetical protein U1Q18_000774 [Sarracenia purpurea var. burkii]
MAMLPTNAAVVEYHALLVPNAAVMEYHGANNTVISLVPVAGISWCKCKCYNHGANANATIISLLAPNAAVMHLLLP